MIAFKIPNNYQVIATNLQVRVSRQKCFCETQVVFDVQTSLQKCKTAIASEEGEMQFALIEFLCES